MKKLYFFFFTFFSLCSFAQINFEPGYFITNNGEKTECLIKNIAWKNNPTDFEYITAKGEPSRKATLTDVKEFNVGNAYKFKRFTVKMDRSSNNLATLSSQMSPDFKQETLFLKVLVEGEVTLYQYEESNLIRYFMSSGGQNPEQLIYKQYLIQATQTAENLQFRQQLSNAMKSGKISNNDLKKVKYRKDDLTDLFLKYNATTSVDVVNFEEKQNKSYINLKAIAGVNSASFEADNSTNNGAIDFDNKLIFKIGLEVEYIMPFNQNKWSLFVDPNFQAYKASTKFSFLTSEIDYSFIEIPLGVRHYFFLSNDSKIFLNAGYVLSLNIKSDFNIGSTKYDLQKSSNYFAGVGYAYSRYSVELRYNFNRGLLESNYAYWSSSYKSVGLNLGYKFL